MLNKRTNILFDDDLWKKLTILAKEKNTSAGELIRQAVRETYLPHYRKAKIAKAILNIKTERKSIFKIDYQRLISYGRKY